MVRWAPAAHDRLGCARRITVALQSERADRLAQHSGAVVGHHLEVGGQRTGRGVGELHPSRGQSRRRSRRSARVGGWFSTLPIETAQMPGARQVQGNESMTSRVDLSIQGVDGFVAQHRLERELFVTGQHRPDGVSRNAGLHAVCRRWPTGPLNLVEVLLQPLFVIALMSMFLFLGGSGF